MASPTGAQQNESDTEDTKSRISGMLDAAVAEALKERQFDSFYQKTAEALKSADEHCVPLITRRILRADYKEKEILLQILKYFKGVEHIGFLQDILSREVITARMGRIILDIFNKSDIILESGISSRLLDLDALSQKINHSVQSGSIEASLIKLFISRPAREQEGIMVELIEEAGPAFAIFLARLFDIDKAVGHAMLRLAVSEPTQQSYALLAELHAKTGNKDILKTAKKMAHILKQQGIDVTAAEEKKPREAVFKTADLPEPRAFATMIDAEGFRLIFMLKPISQHEIKIFNLMLSQDKGIADIEVITSLRREAQKLIKNLYSDKKIEFIEIPAVKAAYLVQEAAALTEQQTGIVSPNMVQWKTLFGDIVPADTLPPVYQIYSAGDIQADTALLRQSEQLFDHSEIPFWFIVTDSARSMWQQYRQDSDTAAADASPQDDAREAAMIKETADDFFTSDRLKKFRRRLEELAYIFHIKGNTELAKISFAQALDLESHGRRPSENSFCSSIIRKGLAYFKSYAAKKSGGSVS
ncbi:MAG: hypothetical protein JW832_10185 [Deltaproteobacteria bacterium]|nr:hypothetical protein [Deltaproteobacteria bacterium]